MPPINAVYYPSWHVYRDKPPSSMDLASITHIFYSFVGVNEDGTLRQLDAWADNDKEVDGVKGCLAALEQIKTQHPHIKTIVSVGGGSSSKEFPALAANPDARWTFAVAIREFCDKHHLDGADIDWEHPQDADAGANYLLFLQDIRRALPSPWFLLTTALPVGEYVLKHIDVCAAAASLDLLNLMAYDFCGAWTDVSGHHAQLLPPGGGNPDDVYPTLRQSAHAGVAYLLDRGFPREKLVLGVPAYARFFGAARDAGHPFEGSGEMDYCELPGGWVGDACVEEGCATAHYVDPEDGGKGFVSFDVPATVRAKARYVKDMGLAGLFYWTGSGDRQGEESLVAAGWSELQ